MGITAVSAQLAGVIAKWTLLRLDHSVTGSVYHDPDI